MLLRFDDGSKGSLMVSQVSAGRKNRLAVEINGSLCSLAWDQEVPQRLWIGHREQPDRLLSDDRACCGRRPPPAPIIPAAILRAGRMPSRI
ncbi:Oxidoreductase [Klebsiella variicola]|uniref:Oxidoreductase n=1 Tax=Klebsiella variicola TaxID=244366 RepID=A0A7H4MF63_KLEVA|nr:Oxidoreductase [Klebsiella variicola]